jgi:hypothetical protein
MRSIRYSLELSVARAIEDVLAKHGYTTEGASWAASVGAEAVMDATEETRKSKGASKFSPFVLAPVGCKTATWRRVRYGPAGENWYRWAPGAVYLG